MVSRWDCIPVLQRLIFLVQTRDNVVNGILQTMLAILCDSQKTCLQEIVCICQT